VGYSCACELDVFQEKAPLSTNQLSTVYFPLSLHAVLSISGVPKSSGLVGMLDGCVVVWR
jgi:hypothetical protein